MASSCDYDSLESRYLSDPLDPRLPIYSNDGNNTAGCYINGAPWRTLCLNFGEDCIGKELYFSDSLNQTVVEFPAGRRYSNALTLPMDIGFRFENDVVSFILTSIPELPLEIKLDGAQNFAQLGIWDGSQWQYTDGGKGIFIIRSLSGFGESFIVSGTFGFDIETENGEFSVYEGRFDFEFDAGFQ